MLYILYEHATGYALFLVKEVEEIGALLPTVERAITDRSLFKSVVKLVAFSPYKSGTNALDNVNSLSEGIVHDDLKLFLETNMPTGKKAKKSNVELGLSDPRMSGTIQDELGIKCAGGDAVTEIFRGLRLHFAGLVKGLTPLGEAKAQLGLGHSYSRAKVKFNVHRADNMIIQSIALLDQLDKDINTFSMRVREWYSYHFPELVKVVNDNYMYCRMVKLIKCRKSLFNADEDLIEKMEAITMDSAKVKAVIDAAKVSMGMDISPIDLINIESFSARVISLTEYRKSLVTYLHDRMTSVAPNLSSLIGDMVGARLISHAGSLTNLAKYPASTVQILGAEKALFRALKTKGNTPKYGLIFHSTFIGRAAAKNKGRISRFLANKCSIASRIDCFTEKPSCVFGEKLKEQVEERLQFFETGDTPRKNLEVMKEALDEFSQLADVEEPGNEAASDESVSKKKKKKKKRKSEADEAVIAMLANEEDAATPAKKPKTESSAEEVEGEVKTKKKKKKAKDDGDDVQVVDTTLDESVVADDVSGKKKKKKKKSSAQDESMNAADESMQAGDEDENGSSQCDAPVTPSTGKKKKKKAMKELNENSVVEIVNGSSQDTTEDDVKKRKKKKRASAIMDDSTVDTPKKKLSLDVSVQDDSVTENTPKKVKKAKKKKAVVEE